MTNPLYQALLAGSRDNPAPFLHRPGGGTIAHATFHEAAARAANALSAIGLTPGDRIAVQVEKSEAALALYAGCVMAGVIFLPLNTAYTAEEMAYFIADAEPGAVICDPGRADGVDPGDSRLLTLDAAGEGSFADLSAQQDGTVRIAPRNADDIAVLLYTSGTTGRSKGAMLTHGNLLSNAEALCELWRIDSGDRLLHALPIFHAHGLFVAVNSTLHAGASMIFLPKFDLDAVLAALPHATTMMGVPTFYTRLLDDDRFTRDLTGHMRLFVSGSAPLLAETHRRFEARTGQRILERYGMTETGMNTSNPFSGERRAGTVGFPLPGVEVRVCDGDGAPLPQGETGMVEVRGPNVFKGYWRMPEKTAEELRDTGFLITGDLGRIDEDGYLHIVGRQKDLVISGGYNVYPKEVESLLDEATWVRESAVIGVPHPDLGEAVVAVVVAEPGETPDPEGLAEGLIKRLARYKQPKRILLADALPRNTMGKVQKNVLRETHSGLFGRDAMAS